MQVDPPFTPCAEMRGSLLGARTAAVTLACSVGGAERHDRARRIDLGAAGHRVQMI
jgi:hypothetical protein